VIRWVATIVFVNYSQPGNTAVSGYAISVMYVGMSLGAVILGPLADKFEPKYAVASIQSGDDIKTVQENLGHATAAFTLDVYGHVTEKMKRESAARMEAFIQAVNA